MKSKIGFSYGQPLYIADFEDGLELFNYEQILQDKGYNVSKLFVSGNNSTLHLIDMELNT